MLGTEQRERKSWVSWWEGMRFPDVIIELLSDSTREVDKGDKKDLYARLFRTTEYYLYDPFSQEFIAYHLHAGDYQEVAPDVEGKCYSPTTGLNLGIRDGWLRWFTAEGTLLPTPSELAAQEKQRADAAQQRAEEERQRAERAEQLLEAYRRRFGSLEDL